MMPDWVGHLIFWSLAVSIVGGMFWYQNRARKRAVEAFSAVAQQLGFDAVRVTKASLHGSHLGREVMMCLVQRGKAESSPGKLATRVSVALSGHAPTLTLANKAGMSRLLVTLGAQDVETGSPGFDAQVVVKSSNPAWARRVLTPGLQRAYLELRAAGRVSSTLSVRSGQVLWDAVGVEADIPFLAALLQLLAGLADACERGETTGARS